VNLHENQVDGAMLKDFWVSLKDYLGVAQRLSRTGRTMLVMVAFFIPRCDPQVLPSLSCLQTSPSMDCGSAEIKAAIRPPPPRHLPESRKLDATEPVGARLAPCLDSKLASARPLVLIILRPEPDLWRLLLWLVCLGLCSLFQVPVQG
jgi:hypothetical protein